MTDAARGWRTAVVAARRLETITAVTLVLRVEDWPGHLPGQHIDVRLTAADGYQASRSYSLAGPAYRTDGPDLDPQRPTSQPDRPTPVTVIEITVQRLDGGEVSPFLVDELTINDELEVRGPLGGWFVWHPRDPEPVLLMAGGSGVVPLMAMIRSRKEGHSAGGVAAFSLICSVRTPMDRLYASELDRRTRADPSLTVHYIYTRWVAEGAQSRPNRVSLQDVITHGWSPRQVPRCFVCGPTHFVEVAARLLVEAGHDPAQVRTERFGGLDDQQSRQPTAVGRSDT